MQLCFFEDSKFTNFHPLALTRPIDDLRTGILTISEKWTYALETPNYSRLLRPNLQGIFSSEPIRENQNCIWINSRYLPSENLIENINDLNEGQCLQYGDTVVAAKVPGTESAKWLSNGSPQFKTLFVLESADYLSISQPWDLFLMNGEQISRDIELLKLDTEAESNISDHAALQDEAEIFIGKGATIEAGCVLNADEGPIYIGENATVMAGSYLRGPVAVCENAIIKMGAQIYPETTIGPVCKVGGEVSNTIFHSYSNKAHDGFIGNSVVGQWCNFGAGTTVSNLKNNYSKIRVTDWMTEEEIETGQQFIGVIMGDHSKTAINCVINSGSIFGVSCNILSRDFPPKMIHSFSWVGSNVIQPYRLDKALETMEVMMARRHIDLSDRYKEMMHHIYDESRQPTR